jgi:phosphoglycerate dehydrogenase-like enzyme
MTAQGSGHATRPRLLVDERKVPQNRVSRRKMANVVISSHIGAQAPGARERQWRLFRENIRRFVAGEPLLCVVDKEKGY